MHFQLTIINLFFLVLLLLIFAGHMAISFRKRYRDRNFQDFQPNTLVIVPVKGLDPTIRENLLSLRKQDYTNYEILAVIDSDKEPVLPILKELDIRYMISTSACRSCSGKVRAIATAFENATGYDVYVVADSDAMFGPGWLSSLVRPLADNRIGVSTTFPHFIPVSGIWSRIKAVWGLVGIGLMQSRITRFVWGGSMAFRSDILTDDNIEFFKKHVSDDVAIMRISKKLGLDIHYVMKAAPDIHSPDDFSTFREWSNRETALSISASRSILWYGLLFYGSQIVLLLGSISFAVLYSPLFIVLIIPYLLFAIRNVENYHQPSFSVFIIALIIPFISMYNLLKASRMKNISWRGKDYDLTQQPSN